MPFPFERDKRDKEEEREQDKTYKHKMPGMAFPDRL